ncbi:MAG TPA: HlyD family type I secretion periplasmic adaptor subunit [Casimicrobiaceae bacterium]|nr:HlyD family type I secretion periplasmic adaptor subunit [Casimicrobiaceae bacterium]
MRRLTTVAGGENSGASFDPSLLRLEQDAPCPLPRRVLYVLFALLAALALGLFAGRLDIVAIADGRLVPRTLLKIVQPAEAGVVRDILVDEGATVVAGQPLLRLDARLADADLRAQSSELAQRRLQLRRIDAELAGRSLVRSIDDPDELFSSAAAQLTANRLAYHDAVAQADALVAKIGQELQSASEVEEKFSRTVPIAQTVAVRYERLREEGFVSELAALDRVRERIEREQELRAQRHAVLALKASRQQAEKQRAQVDSNYRRTLHAERAEAGGHASRLREELDKQIVRREQIELTAPAAGVVKDLAVRTSGTVVAAGTVLMTIVPAGDALEAEVMIRNEDAGFVRDGQSAQLKVAAFPFQKYGLVAADVLRVGPDAQEAQPARSTAEETAVASGYRARLALKGQSVETDGGRLPLTSGMAVSAEIHLGHRRVIDYVLAPVKRAWHEAARER